MPMINMKFNLHKKYLGMNLNSLNVIHTAKYFASLSDVGLYRDCNALIGWSADVGLV